MAVFNSLMLIDVMLHYDLVTVQWHAPLTLATSQPL